LIFFTEQYFSILINLFYKYHLKEPLGDIYNRIGYKKLGVQCQLQ